MITCLLKKIWHRDAHYFDKDRYESLNLTGQTVALRGKYKYGAERGLGKETR